MTKMQTISKLRKMSWWKMLRKINLNDINQMKSRILMRRKTREMAVIVWEGMITSRDKKSRRFGHARW